MEGKSEKRKEKRLTWRCKEKEKFLTVQEAVQQHVKPKQKEEQPSEPKLGELYAALAKAQGQFRNPKAKQGGYCHQ